MKRLTWGRDTLLKAGVVLVFLLVIVFFIIAVVAHISASRECGAAGGSYEVVDRIPVTRFTTIDNRQIPYTDWEPVYDCVQEPR